MNKLFLLCYFCFSFTHLYALTIDEAKSRCLDLGFKADTEQLGNCVLKLSKSEADQDSSPSEINNKKLLHSLVRVIPTKSFKDCDVCPEMVEIPSGSFLMGSPNDPESDPFSNLKPLKIANDNEKPQHSVNIRSFAMGKFEVTQEQWYSVMGNNPSRNKGRNLPVESFAWDDVQLFIQKLSQKTGKKYRLPTEAEWEHAARAGTTTPYYWGDSKTELNLYAWSREVANATNPIGLKSPNQFGLYDMIGNVWEWTQDCWNLNYIGAPIDGSAWNVGDCSRRVLRGGSWRYDPKNLRSAFRFDHSHGIRSDDVGIRVAREL